MIIIKEDIVLSALEIENFMASTKFLMECPSDLTGGW